MRIHFAAEKDQVFGTSILKICGSGKTEYESLLSVDTLKEIKQQNCFDRFPLEILCIIMDYGWGLIQDRSEGIKFKSCWCREP
jgi:hypothetical protein